MKLLKSVYVPYHCCKSWFQIRYSTGGVFKLYYICPDAVLQDNLLHEIGDVKSEYSAVVKAIQNIELLKAEGLSVAQVSNPLSWFANSQQDFLQQRLRHLVERHIETVTSVVAIEVC